VTTLIEASNVRQIPGESRRRWFASDDFDLIVSCNDLGAPISFQLCYNKLRAQHALTWEPTQGFVHSAVDDGEDVGIGYKRTPILLADGAVNANRVIAQFTEASVELPREIAEFVIEALRKHPAYVREG
jgi:hypothetical protein